MTECVVSVDRAVARLLDVEGPEFAVRGDFAERLWIGKTGVELERASLTDIGHIEVMNLKFQRQLVQTVGVDDEIAFFRFEMVDDHLDLATRGGDSTKFAPCFFGRNIQRKTRDVDVADAHGDAQQSYGGGPEAEPIHIDKRLNARKMNVGVALSIDFQATPGNSKTVENGNMQGGEVDAALEARGKGFDHAGPEERLGMVGENGKKDDKHKSSEQQGRDDLSGARSKEACWERGHGCKSKVSQPRGKLRVGRGVYRGPEGPIQDSSLWSARRFSPFPPSKAPRRHAQTDR